MPIFNSGFVKPPLKLGIDEWLHAMFHMDVITNP